MKFYLFRVSSLFAIALIIYSCSPKTSGGLSETQIKISPYALTPIAETFVYHTSDDSSELHLKLPLEQLLSSRKNDQTDFQAILEVNLLITPLNQSGNTDTLEYSVIAETANGSSKGMLYHKKSFYLSDGQNYQLKLKLTDKTRNTSSYTLIQVNKTNPMNRENFLIKNEKNEIPYFSVFTAPNSNIQVITNRVELSSLTFLQKSAELNLPPPPSSSSKNSLPKMSEFSAILPDISGDTAYLKDLEVGDILLRNTNGKGLTILVRPTGFPETSSVYEMIQPLRYISSRKEFEKMEGSSNLKLSLDNFWLNCGDTKERSKELISIFYSRVEESNRFFSSYKSGWRTDRGLINIVFGSPTDLEINEDSEIWTYGDKTDLGSIQFKFNKIENEFSDNYFELERNPIYKSEWAKRVGAWRNGRIYN